MELYESLGFKENPFSTFSAEEEKNFLNQIYVNPLFYNTLKSDIVNGHSRFVLGARGIGKTALLLQLKTAVSEEGAFTIIIDEFDGIPLKNNESEILRTIIESVVTTYCIQISKTPSLIKKLDKYQKEKLSFIIKEFFKTLSRKEYERLYDKATGYKTRNVFRIITNAIFNRPINFAISSGIEVISDTVRNSFGLPQVNKEEFYKNYIPELILEKIDVEGEHEKLFDFKALKGVLNDLAEIIQKSGYKTTVVFFDKIDEYTSLNGGIKSVAEFLESFLKDTTLLMNRSYSLVFSIWDVLKSELMNKGVRFDKIKPVDITWQTDDLKRILNKRIEFFSQNKLTTNNIVDSENKINDIIMLANYSPRYLFRQLGYIYDQQAEIDASVSLLSDEAVERGKLIYSKSFEYYAIYPTRRGAKEDILKNINRLLKIGKDIIRTKDFVDIYNVSSQTAISYIGIVQEYNLVRELPQTENGAKVYEVNDPVIKHLIKSGVTELK